MDYGVAVLGGGPIGCEGSLSPFKVQGNFLLLCSSTHMLAGLDRTKGGHIPATKNRGVGCLPTPPVTTLMKQKTVKKTSTPGQLSVQLESWKICCKTWQIRLTPTRDFKRKMRVSVCSRREWKPTSRIISCTKNANILKWYQTKMITCIA